MEKKKVPFPSWKRDFTCRERGIRTPGGLTLNGFQDRRNRPLCQLSGSITLTLLYAKTLKKAFSSAEKAFCREGGIRTPDTVAGITVFETVAFDHSATSLSGSPSDWGVQK